LLIKQKLKVVVKGQSKGACMGSMPVGVAGIRDFPFQGLALKG